MLAVIQVFPAKCEEFIWVTCKLWRSVSTHPKVCVEQTRRDQNAAGPQKASRQTDVRLLSNCRDAQARQ